MFEFAIFEAVLTLGATGTVTFLGFISRTGFVLSRSVDRLTVAVEGIGKILADHEDRIRDLEKTSAARTWQEDRLRHLETEGCNTAKK